MTALNEKQSKLITELTDLGYRLDELWNYHPNNPIKKDIEAVYNELYSAHQSVLDELDKLI